MKTVSLMRLSRVLRSVFMFLSGMFFLYFYFPFIVIMILIADSQSKGLLSGFFVCIGGMITCTTALIYFDDPMEWYNILVRLRHNTDESSR